MDYLSDSLIGNQVVAKLLSLNDLFAFAIRNLVLSIAMMPLLRKTRSVAQFIAPCRQQARYAELSWCAQSKVAQSSLCVSTHARRIYLCRSLMSCLFILASFPLALASPRLVSSLPESPVLCKRKDTRRCLRNSCHFGPATWQVNTL